MREDERRLGGTAGRLRTAWVVGSIQLLNREISGGIIQFLARFRVRNMKALLPVIAMDF